MKYATGAFLAIWQIIHRPAEKPQILEKGRKTT
jgi:hypothetical protein